MLSGRLFVEIMINAYHSKRIMKGIAQKRLPQWDTETIFEGDYSHFK